MERLKILRRQIEAARTSKASAYKDPEESQIITDDFLASIKDKSAEDQKALMAAKHKVLQFFAMRREVDFKFDTEGSGIKVNSAINKTTGYKMLHIVSKLKVSAEKAYEFFANTTKGFELNKNIRSFKIISDIDANTAYFYNIGKGILIVKDRDFVFVFHRLKLDDGRWVTAAAG